MVVALLPSEIARLILNYLEEQCLNKTHATFLNECKYLAECKEYLERGIGIPKTIHGKTLVDFMVIDRVSGLMASAHVSTQTDAIVVHQPPLPQSLPPPPPLQSPLPPSPHRFQPTPLESQTNVSPQKPLNGHGETQRLSVTNVTDALASNLENGTNNKKDDLLFACFDDITAFESTATTSNSNRATPNKRRPILIGKNVEKLPQFSVSVLERQLNSIINDPENHIQGDGDDTTDLVTSFSSDHNHQAEVDCATTVAAAAASATIEEHSRLTSSSAVSSSTQSVTSSATAPSTDNSMFLIPMNQMIPSTTTTATTTTTTSASNQPTLSQNGAGSGSSMANNQQQQQQQQQQIIFNSAAMASATRFTTPAGTFIIPATSNTSSIDFNSLAGMTSAQLLSCQAQQSGVQILPMSAATANKRPSAASDQLSVVAKSYANSAQLSLVMNSSSTTTTSPLKTTFASETNKINNNSNNNKSTSSKSSSRSSGKREASTKSETSGGGKKSSSDTVKKPRVYNRITPTIKAIFDKHSTTPDKDASSSLSSPQFPTTTATTTTSSSSSSSLRPKPPPLLCLDSNSNLSTASSSHNDIFDTFDLNCCKSVGAESMSMSLSPSSSSSLSGSVDFANRGLVLLGFAAAGDGEDNNNNNNNNDDDELSLDDIIMKEINQPRGSTTTTTTNTKTRRYDHNEERTREASKASSAKTNGTKRALEVSGDDDDDDDDDEFDLNIKGGGGGGGGDENSRSFSRSSSIAKKTRESSSGGEKTAATMQLRTRAPSGNSTNRNWF